MSEAQNKQNKDSAGEQDVISQGNKAFRQGFPEWIRQMPHIRFPAEDDSFTLIKRETLFEDIKNKAKEMHLEEPDDEALKRLDDDIQFLEYELVRLFRQRDYHAKYEQNRYRIYQLTFMILATLATLVGSFQALALSNKIEWLPALAFIETAVALATTYIATISSREAPLPRWLMNRRRAEYLRREFFRYLMDLSPYDEISGPLRQQRLSVRAANINRGVYPDKSAD